MTDDHETIISQLRKAHKEIAGRKRYEEDLKAQLINQDVELCGLKDENKRLRAEANATRDLLDEYTPYRGMNIPVSHATRWLIRDKNSWRTQAERDQRELRPLKDERSRAIGLLMDHDIYEGDLEDGIKKLLARRKAPRWWSLRSVLSRND